MNSEDVLSAPAFNYYSGNIASCTLTTIVLDASASATDDIYNNHIIEITGGLGRGTFRQILDYDGTTKTLTIKPLGESPNTSSTYVIHRHSGMLEIHSRNIANP